MTDEKVAVVTGANKGIGFATVILLCQRFPRWTVYLTARDEERGRKAVEELKNTYKLEAKFHQLEVASEESVKNFAKFLRETHPGGIDLLINNAGVSEIAGAFQGEEAKTRVHRPTFRTVVATNYFGVLNVSKELLPLMKNGARVVNVSSKLAQTIFSQLSPSLQEKFERIASEEELTNLMRHFVEIDDEDVRGEGWMHGDFLDQLTAGYNGYGLEILPYGVSKLAVNILTSLQQKQIDEMTTDRLDVAINACTPGRIKSAMNPYGTKSPEEGAEVILYAATVPHGDTHLGGQFIDADLKICDALRS